MDPMNNNGRPRSKPDGDSEMKARIESLGPWFHNLRLEGVQTAPDHFLGDFPSCQVAAPGGPHPRQLAWLNCTRHRL